MADNSTFQKIMPDDVAGYIAQFLTVQELATFKKICKQFNFVGSNATFLQPLYNRLYKLDNTLSPIFTTENAALEFEKGFKKIKDRQKDEINYLYEVYGSHRGRVSSDIYDMLNRLLTSASHSIKELEERNALLDEINLQMLEMFLMTYIVNSINGDNDQKKIVIESNKITRFIIPDDNLPFFQDLQELYINDNHMLRVLDLSAFPALEWINCSNNKNLNKLVLNDLPLVKSLVCDNTPMLMDLQLHNASPEFKEKCQPITERVLFNRLYHAKTPTVKDAAILELTNLGLYNTQNCLKHSCLYEAGLIAQNQASSVLEKTSNFFLSFMRPGKKETDATMTQEGSLKRKRDEISEDDEPNNKKKHKKPGG